MIMRRQNIKNKFARDNSNSISTKKRIVIKLSGSLFGLNANKEFIEKYAHMLLDIHKSLQPIVISGGGTIARQYINFARMLGSDEANLDIMGIDVSRLNARLLLVALGDRAYPNVPKSLEEVTTAAESGKIVVSGGLHPGQSTNATSALIAERVGAMRFLNATDVEGIYDSDPNTNKNAKLFRRITIQQCMEILVAGSSMAGTYDLMDIVALKVIERSKIPTRIVRSDIINIKRALNDESKIGTEIVITA